MEQKTICSWVKYLPFLIIPLLAITWGISKYQSTNKLPVNHLQIKTNLPRMGQGVLPEQRRAFAVKFQRNANTAYKDAIFTTTGDFHTTFSIQSDSINSNMVYSMMSSSQEPLREIGFKHLILSNNKEVWDIDLRN